MSDSVDEERAEMAREYRSERAKRALRQFMDAHRFWLEGLSVTLIAQRLGVRRDRVYFLLRALELVDSRVKRPSRPTHLYGLRVPGIDEQVANGA